MINAGIKDGGSGFINARKGDGGSAFISARIGDGGSNGIGDGGSGGISANLLPLPLPTLPLISGLTCFGDGGGGC